MLCHSFGITAETGERPGACAMRVGHRLQCRERFRGDDEQRFRWIKIACRLHEIGAIDIGDEAKGHRTIAVELECLIGHNWPEVGATDTDVDDVADSFAGMPFPLATTDTIRKVGHLDEYDMDLRHDVLAVD